ncbi:MAG: hypothetical protein C4555_06355 [Dehalococcoidia bacterium]|nr:MAG: hypothetical protein C4555_06355 [Dehalococcoidia bacterium]
MAPGQAIAIQNTAGQPLAAPVEVWLGMLIMSLPDEWRDELWHNVQNVLPKVVKPPKPQIVLARS